MPHKHREALKARKKQQADAQAEQVKAAEAAAKAEATATGQGRELQAHIKHALEQKMAQQRLLEWHAERAAAFRAEEAKLQSAASASAGEADSAASKEPMSLPPQLAERHPVDRVVLAMTSFCEQDMMPAFMARGGTRYLQAFIKVCSQEHKQQALKVIDRAMEEHIVRARIAQKLPPSALSLSTLTLPVDEVSTATQTPAIQLPGLPLTRANPTLDSISLLHLNELRFWLLLRFSFLASLGALDETLLDAERFMRCDPRSHAGYFAVGAVLCEMEEQIAGPGVVDPKHERAEELRHTLQVAVQALQAALEHGASEVVREAIDVARFRLGEITHSTVEKEASGPKIELIEEEAKKD